MLSPPDDKNELHSIKNSRVPGQKTVSARWQIWVLGTLVYLGCVTDLVWGGGGGLPTVCIFSLFHMCILICFFKRFECVNDSVHSEHLKDFSSVWILMCLMSFHDIMKDFSHFVQLKGFSPVWIFEWVFRLPSWLNDLVHSEHLKGFSPVWILICLISCHDIMKDFSHCVQLKGFSPVWVFMCFFRLPR